jgi:prepilin-type N-terminal cleavage/methylation domain-containing protein
MYAKAQDIAGVDMTGCTTTRRKVHGFSLLELLIAVAVAMVLAAIAAPTLMGFITTLKVRYAARDLSGLMQLARIQAVKKNTFYSILPQATGGGQTEYFVDLSKSGAYAAGDRVITMAAQTTVHPGTGSGAPNEVSFVTSLNFTVDAAGNPATFNARGLPCVVVGNTCSSIPGQGLIYFLSTLGTRGNLSWAAVAVTPSGHAQVWTCDGAGNWVQL